MGYLNEDGLARYDGLIKNWVTFKSGTVDGIDPLLNWQKTETAASVTCYPLPAAPLDPVVTFAFTETDPAEGEKSPTNPSTITGVSSITVTRCETVGVDSTDYTVSLGGTFYGGSVDLSAGTMTVTVGGSAISTFSSAAVNTNTIMFGALGSYAHGGNITPSVCACNRLAFATGNTDTEHWRQAGYSGDAGYVFFLNKSRLDVSEAVDPSNPTNAEWLAAGNAWLADNPIFVASSLATPHTVSLTPTQIYSLPQPDPYTPRLNTVYSDQQSVQVGYPKSPQATSAELTNAIVSLGGNI